METVWVLVITSLIVILQSESAICQQGHPGNKLL